MKRQIFLMLIISTAILPGQVYSPPAVSTTKQTNTAGDTTIQQQPRQSGGSPFGQEIPLLDPSAETISIGGKSFPIMDNRMVKARFEKFLNQPPEETAEAQKYHDVVKDILATISPMRKTKGKLEEGFKKLPRAAAYPGDAGLSSSLAQAIYTAVQSKSDIRGLERLNQSLEREKKEIISEDYWEKQRTGTGNAQLGRSGDNKEKGCC